MLKRNIKQCQSENWILANGISNCIMVFTFSILTNFVLKLLKCSTIYLVFAPAKMYGSLKVVFRDVSFVEEFGQMKWVIGATNVNADKRHFSITVGWKLFYLGQPEKKSTLKISQIFKKMYLMSSLNKKRMVQNFGNFIFQILIVIQQKIKEMK